MFYIPAFPLKETSGVHSSAKMEIKKFLQHSNNSDGLFYYFSLVAIELERMALFLALSDYLGFVLATSESTPVG